MLTSVPQFMRTGRDRLSQEMGKWPWLSWYSPAEISLRHAVERHVKPAIHGSILDAGAGHMPYRSFLESHGANYTSMDIEARGHDIHIVGDVMEMNGISDESFDMVLSSEVLEHVARPDDAMREFARVLKPGGTVILTVPHLSRIHEAPNDYFRFTRYGMMTMAEAVGLQVSTVENVGSIFSFIAHQLASALVPPSWNIPILRWVSFAVSALFITAPAIALDRLPVVRSLFPLNVLLIAKKPVGR